MSDSTISQIGNYWTYDHEDRLDEIGPLLTHKFVAKVIVEAADQGESAKRLLRRVAAHTQYIAMFGRGVVWGISSSEPLPSEADDIFLYPVPLPTVKFEIQGMVGPDTSIDIVRGAMGMVHGAIDIIERSYDSKSGLMCLIGVRQMLVHALDRTSESIQNVRRSQPIPLLEAPSEGSSPVSWIDTSVTLYQEWKKEESLDVIFDTIDDMLLGSKFSACDTALSEIQVEDLSNAQLLTVLTATIAAKKHLLNRDHFVSRVEDVLKLRGADAPRLLAGLE